MNVIMHFPKSESCIKDLSDKIATVHAEAVATHLGRLSCPKDQKLKLVEEAIQQLKAI